MKGWRKLGRDPKLGIGQEQSSERVEKRISKVENAERTRRKERVMETRGC